MKTIGVLALQGAFREHIHAIKRTGHFPVEVRVVEQLKDIDGLIIPGGESTTISKLMVKYGFIDGLKQFKKPIFGTCAGAILLANNVPNLEEPVLGLMDITIDRNAYGRQVDSFEAELDIRTESRVKSQESSKNHENGFGNRTVHKNSTKNHGSYLVDVPINNEKEQSYIFKGIFIRAPQIIKVGNGVEVLASYDNKPVLVYEGNNLAATFHPELTEDFRVHRFFIDMISQKSAVTDVKSGQVSSQQGKNCIS